MNELNQFMDTINSMIDTYTSWTATFGPNTETALNVIGICGTALAAIAVVATPLVLLGVAYDTHVEKEYEKIFELLDNCKTEVFNINQKIFPNKVLEEACQVSRENALDWQDPDASTALTYETEKECLNKHGAAEEVPENDLGGYFINGVWVTIPDEIAYQPPIIGWQAAAHDLGISVPLYHTKVPGFGVRKDGKLVAMPR
jgi:hypothetical protein